MVVGDCSTNEAISFRIFARKLWKRTSNVNNQTELCPGIVWAQISMLTIFLKDSYRFLCNQKPFLPLHVLIWKFWSFEDNKNRQTILKQTKISIKKAKISEWRCTEYQTIILNKPSHHSLPVSRRKIVGSRAFGQAPSPPVPNKSDWTFSRTYWVIECDFFFLNHLDYV